MMVTLDIVLMVFALAFFFSARGPAVRRRRGAARAGAAASAAAHLTVSLPSMPPSRWPGTEQ